MAKHEKGVTKDALIGMQVIDAEGRLIGTVKDISFIVGKTGVSLYIENKKGESQNVAWDDVQAVGDFVLLKPTRSQETQPQQMCPTCRGPLTYIPQYQRWYCYKCKKYA